MCWFRGSVIKNPATYLMLLWVVCVRLRWEWVVPYQGMHYAFPPGGLLVTLGEMWLPWVVVAVLWVRDALAHRG